MDISCLDESLSKKSLSSSKYKGVVPQPNGRWGAQIYEKHQRVWLGTFNEEEQAAKAYDIAAQRFRGQNAITNFKPPLEPNKDDMEKIFLNSHSKAEIVDMLRKHTYINELEQSKYDFACHGATRKRIRGNELEEAVLRELLFEKVATPSDVGKLNRMVVPKQHAEKHFTLHNGIASKGVLLNFEDDVGKVWRFRYCYWSSSQSYVLTKGWSRFVKEKKLRAGDMVCFWRSMGSDKRLFIDRKLQNGSGLVEMSNRVDPLIPVQSIRVVRLFGVNILDTKKLCCR